MVEPGQYAYVAEIESDLASLQRAVGGLIDCAYPWKEPVCIVCNDEGLINGMPLNRTVERYGALAGPFFVCGIDADSFCSLNDTQVEKYLSIFQKPMLFLELQTGVLAVSYDDASLPRAPETVKQRAAEQKGLPDFCFYSIPGYDQLMLLQYGKSGYFPIEAVPHDMPLTQYAEQLNRILHVTQEQSETMLYKALYGWEAPALERKSGPKRRSPQNER